MMDGVVVIDKEEGKTSRAAVDQVMRLLHLKKAGHVGTLDPLATGVLPICLGEATKLADYLAGGVKEYRATLLLGVQTETLDVEGPVAERREVTVSAEDVRKVMEEMTGTMEQTPPRYSAVKYRGKPSYHWARKGVSLDLRPRTVTIHRLSVTAVTLPTVTFDVVCSKGTYIRSLCADIGARLGCGACLAALRRTRSGLFDASAALSLRGLDGEEARRRITDRLLSLTDVLAGVPAIPVGETEARRIREGVQPSVAVLRGHDSAFLVVGDMVTFIRENRVLVATAEMLYGSGQMDSLDSTVQAVRILRVFNE